MIECVTNTDTKLNALIEWMVKYYPLKELNQRNNINVFTENNGNKTWHVLKSMHVKQHSISIHKM
jgi:hypothetical protein